MTNNWKLVGLYYEKYTPLCQIYGIKLIEGYFNIKTGKHRMVVFRKIKINSCSVLDDIVEEMTRIEYKSSEHFLVDVSKINIEIIKTNGGY